MYQSIFHQAQLDAYIMERNALMGKTKGTQSELEKLSRQYAQLLGNQNNKQKIKYVLKIKEENIALKQVNLRVNITLIYSILSSIRRILFSKKIVYFNIMLDIQYPECAHHQLERCSVKKWRKLGDEMIYSINISDFIDISFLSISGTHG